MFFLEMDNNDTCNAKSSCVQTSVSLALLELHLGLWFVNGHQDTLGFEPAFKSRFTLVSSNTRFLESTKGSSRIKVVVGVDPDSTGSQLMSHGQGSGGILRGNAGGQSVLAQVGSFNDFGIRLELENGHDRAKDFFLRNRHAIRHI